MSTYALKQEQEKLERDSIQRGIDRYVSNLEKEEGRGRGMDNPVVDRVIRGTVRKLIPVMAALQAKGLQHNKETVAKGGRPLSWGWHVNLVEPEVLAYITIKAIIGTNRVEASLQHHSIRIGHMVQCEYWWGEARKAERKRAKDTGEYNRIEMLKRGVKQINPKAIRKWMTKLDDLGITPWDKTTRLQVGAALVDAALPHMQDIVHVNVTRTKKGHVHRMETTVSFQPEFLETLDEQHMSCAAMRPWVLPMIIPPTPWEVRDGALSGGYRTLGESHHIEFIRGSLNDEGHTTVDDVPPQYLEALNAIQRTPWRVHPTMLRFVQEAFERDEGPLPYEPPMVMPDLVPKETWAGLSNDERNAVVAERADVHNHNNHHHNKKQTALRAVLVAEEFKEREAIYFPHSMDWRGRAYPIPQDLHPQGPDMIKALLLFAEGKPLGVRGLHWLECHAANCYGLDKASRDAQRQWVDDQWDNIAELVMNPWSEDSQVFWLQADEPWQFMAACVELWNVYMGTEAPEACVSHLPVSIDGSCNGMQHLSAMGRDPVGAEAVNLVPGERQDIYQIVADKVSACVEDDAADHLGYGPKSALGTKPEALAWDNNVTRKTVKRGVMTTPYGVTPRGIATQLKQDGFTRKLEGDELANANYLRDRMVEAIDGTIVKGKQIMAWMQDCAVVLAKRGQGISWVTPLGLKVTQYYSKPMVNQVTTCMGKMTLHRYNRTAAVRIAKQKNSVAPNIIHSFDAAHMMMVTLSMPDDSSFAMVHDSFGTHACDVDTLLEVTKETFITIYREDWFEALYTDFRFFSGNMKLPEPPAMGDFDVESVMESDYFFA